MRMPFAKSKATQANEVAEAPPKQPGFWKSFDWKLMLALLFPVTLETLDYTGSCRNCSVAYSFRV